MYVAMCSVLKWFGFIKWASTYLITHFSIYISFVRVKLVRLGHPARLLPQVLESALDAQVHKTIGLRKKLNTRNLFFC
jgi:hypothetical protein